jgi:poly-gamma-glutamate synthesis protein (capsule biosynthesis protein)
VRDDAKQTVTVTAVGDLMFDTRMKRPRVFFYTHGSASCIPGYRSATPVPFINTEESRRWVVEHGQPIDDISRTSHATQSVLLDLPVEAHEADFPFREVRSELAQSDMVFGNLECPLSTQGRAVRNDCCYCANPDFARAMGASNFKVVSFSNNHCMDFGEAAFYDTLSALQRNGIHVAGAGRNYDDARKPVLLESNGIRMAFLAYNLFGPDTVYALPDESGVIPLNDLVVRQDVERIRKEVDFIFASVHWGVEGEPRPSAWLIDCAHSLVDYGIDVVFGHHSHIPGSIEIYKSKPIFYSLGNFIFGHTHRFWTDNLIVKLTLDRDQVRKIEIIPIGSRGIEQFQPRLLSGDRASSVVKFVTQVSELFGTNIVQYAERGVINIQSAEETKTA